MNTYQRPLKQPRRRITAAVNNAESDSNEDPRSRAARCSDELLVVLADEMQAIIKHDAEKLATLSRDKQRCIGALEQCSHALGQGPVEPKLRDLLTRCREHNHRNGTLLRIRHQHCERTLQILQAADQHTTVYDGRGSPKSQLRPRYQAQA